jgi:hypothetical protein
MKNYLKLKIFLLSLLGIALFFVAPRVLAADKRTQTIWTTSGEGVDLIPYVRVDKKALFVDFEANNFNNIEYIYYNLNYDTDEPGRIRGVKGSFVPSTLGADGFYNGRPYYRRELILGVCSGVICTYHKNPRNVKLTANTKMLSGKVDQYTQVLSIPDDQF